MKNFFKNKKSLLIFFLVFFFLFTFFLGLKNLISNNKKSSSTKTSLLEAKKFYKNELNKYPEFKDLLKILKSEDISQSKEFLNFLQAEMIQTGGKKIEIEVQLIKESQDVLKNIEVDNSKSNMEYVNEFKQEIEKLKLVNLDFNDKNNLALSGEFILNIASNLSRIKPSKDYYQFHKTEVLLLTMMGKSLVKLANSNDHDEAMALSMILNNLADLQEKIIEKL